MRSFLKNVTLNHNDDVITLTLCLPKNFHASCTIGVQWTPDFKKVFDHKNLTQINKLKLKTAINEQFKDKNR